jgi:hypothetical protein
MMLSIEITPETEKALRKEAARCGVSLVQYARALLEERLPNAGAAASTNAEERSATFREWAETHNIDNPALAEAEERSR